ncbi:SET domain-containing protein [Stagonosporopsis vannaccii]|nr:SET domain-containing protein [Stagonosporopsis vannaccii]
MPNNIPEFQIADFLTKYTKPLLRSDLTLTNGTNTECFICHTPYADPPQNYVHPDLPDGDEEYAVQIQNRSECKHIFGRRCLEQHIRGGNPWSHTCPLCRTEWFPAPNSARRDMLVEIERTLMVLAALDIVGGHARQELGQVEVALERIREAFSIDSSKMADFQVATERFLDWFKSVGGEFQDDLLEIQDLRSQGAGRGIVAKKDIPQDCTLFTIPRSAIINVETSELPKKLPKVFEAAFEEEDEDTEPLDPWESLILILLYEHLQGDASRWKPYLDVLPTAFDTPMFWDESELKELKGTVLTQEKIGKQSSDDKLRTRIIPVVVQNPAIFYPAGQDPLSEDVLLDLAHRMGSTIMAYAFDLDNEEDEVEDEEDGWVVDKDAQRMLGMVPMADILNANADFNAHVNHGEALEVTSLRSDIKAGTEILNYYGAMPSSEVLRRYGYVTPEYSRYDEVEIPRSAIAKALGSATGLSSSDLINLGVEIDAEEDGDPFIIERDSGAPNEEGRLIEKAKLDEFPELEEELKDALKIIKKHKPELVADKRKRDGITNTVITQVLTEKLAEYPTSVQEDRALLKKSGLTKRHRMAIEVRLGEKVLLEEALAMLKARTEAATYESEERPAKKTKR